MKSILTQQKPLTKNNKKYGGKMAGFFNVFKLHFLQTFGTLKNHSTNVSKHGCVSTPDTD